MPLTPVITALGRGRLVHPRRVSPPRRLQRTVQAFEMGPDAVIAAVKDSGLRGRGGAGFPTGLKWVSSRRTMASRTIGRQRRRVGAGLQGHPDHAGEPARPHRGIIVASYAIRADHAFVYIRGEVPHDPARSRRGPAGPRAGYLGDNILGSASALNLVVHAGAGAYICGEETALLDSLEGRRGQPRLKPRSRPSRACTPVRPW